MKVKALWFLRKQAQLQCSDYRENNRGFRQRRHCLEGQFQVRKLCAASLCAGVGSEQWKPFSWRQSFGHYVHLERKEEFGGLCSRLRIQYCPLLFMT